MELILILCLSALSVACFDESLNKEWVDFKLKFNKHYNDEDEENMRRLIFEANYKFILEMNRNNDFLLEINEFGDMTSKEFFINANGFSHRNVNEDSNENGFSNND